jgi:hypothetical protein
MKFSASVATQLFAALTVAGACALVSGCSSGAYPSILAEPAPRDDTALTPDQVKQAMDGLISDRNHLCSQAVASDPPSGPPAGCGPQTDASAAPAAGAPAKP